jgi:hypothetical protein
MMGYYYRDIYRDFCLPIISSTSSLTVPLNPIKKSTPTCVPQTIGIALDGVQIWNQYAPEDLSSTKLSDVPPGLQMGVDAGRGFFAEPMDACGGHPGPGQAYHYHKLPAHGLGLESICFAHEVEGEPSGVLGVAVDGFPLYGPFDAEGRELTPADLDECNGMEVDGEYRYIATRDFPYGPGCMWGEVQRGGEELCWFAEDWLAAMEATDQEYYRDCGEFPLPESNGTQGCLSYHSNPALYERSFGSRSGWEELYDETCGSAQWLREFARADPEIMGSDAETADPPAALVGCYVGAAALALGALGVLVARRWWGAGVAGRERETRGDGEMSRTLI